MAHQHEHHHASHTITLRFKYHPDQTKEHVKKILGVMKEIQLINARCFKINSTDYQFWFAYGHHPMEKFQADSGKLQEVIKSHQGNVTIPTCAMYGDCGADVVSAILQSWPCETYADEVELPTPSHHWQLVPTNPICFMKLRINLHQDEARQVLKQWKELEESLGVQDLRTYQLNSQDYVLLADFPVKTMDEYRRHSTAALDFMKKHEKEVILLDNQMFGDLPAAVLSAGLQEWKPSVVACEMKF
jgi:hypothetical protein